MSALALLAVAAAGCGGSAQTPRVAFHGVPRVLAQDWERQASEIAGAASAGESCRALHLAKSLRDDVIAEQRRLPLRLRSPLLTSVNRLADRITCTPVVQAPPGKPHEKPKPPEGKGKHEPPKHHGPPGHGKGHDG